MTTPPHIFEIAHPHSTTHNPRLSTQSLLLLLLPALWTNSQSSTVGSLHLQASLSDFTRTFTESFGTRQRARSEQ